MKKTIIISLVFIAFVFSGCGKKRANYYRQIDTLSNNGSIIGTYPVPDKSFNKVNCWHFIYDKKGKLMQVEYFKLGKTNNNDVFGFAKIKIDYSESYEKRVYQDKESNPIPDTENGVYSVRLKLDKNNNPISLFNYNKDGELAEDKIGVAQYLWTLDEKGRRISSIRVNKNGERIIDYDGYYELRRKYDKKGNVIETSNHGKDGQLLENYSGYAIGRWKYNEQRNCIENCFMGTDEQLKEVKYGGYAIIRYKYDNNGNETERRFFGVDEQLKELKDLGVAIICKKYDDPGNIIEIKYSGTDEQLRKNVKTGYAVIRRKYNNLGNVAEESYFGTDEQPENNKYGCAIYRLSYNEEGKVKGVVGLNKDGKTLFEKGDTGNTDSTNNTNKTKQEEISNSISDVKGQIDKTLGNLGTLRSTLNIFYSDNDGVYPTTGFNYSLVPKYLTSIPSCKLQWHPSSNYVIFLYDVGDEPYTKFVTDSGKWMYNADKSSDRWGDIFIDCTHVYKGKKVYEY